MVTGARRNGEAVADGVARWVGACPELVPGTAVGAQPLRVAGVSHAEGGLANETLLVDLGPGHPGIVVRLPPLEPTFPDYDLAPQAAVQNAVDAHGVPAPAPAVAVEDPQWIGCPFLVMPHVRGDVPGEDSGAVGERPLHREAQAARIRHERFRRVRAAESQGRGERFAGLGLPQLRPPTAQRLAAHRHQCATVGREPDRRHLVAVIHRRAERTARVRVPDPHLTPLS